MAVNYVLLNRQTLTASAASVTFSNIPQSGYTDLKIVISTRYSNAISMGGFGIYLNGVTTNQSGKYLLGTGSATSSGSVILIDSDGASDTSNTFSSTEIYIPNYTSSNYKSFSVDNVSEANATYAEQIMSAGLWSSTAAITSVGFARGSASWDVGSSFSLYGIAAVGTTPASAPKASGGDIVTTDGTYYYHAFLGSGVFTPKTSLTCDVLVVAGGGAGGSSTDATGGGGAGGYRTTLDTSALSLTTTSYSVVIGAGGAGSTVVGTTGVSGTNSSFSTITSTGGGGGSTSGVSGVSGGSGGGGGFNLSGGSGNAGGYTPVEGYAGGTGNSYSNYFGAGGGGAGAVGQNPNNAPANGGDGRNTNSAWATATGTGVSGYFAGGGGGGSSTSSAASGGAGGGGQGGTYVANAVSGTASTGSGGGGTRGTGSNYVKGGSGGSGIVIIRYAM